MSTFLVILTIANIICVIVFGWLSYQSFLKLRDPRFDRTTNINNLSINLFVCLLNLAAIII